MTQADPSKRPTINAVRTQYDALVKPLSRAVLRSRLVPIDEDPGLIVLRNFRHKFRTFRKPPIPLPH